MRGGLRGVRRQRLGRFVSLGDELPANGTKLRGQVGAWLKQRACMKPAGKSFFVSERRKPLRRSFPLFAAQPLKDFYTSSSEP